MRGERLLPLAPKPQQKPQLSLVILLSAWSCSMLLDFYLRALFLGWKICCSSLSLAFCPRLILRFSAAKKKVGCWAGHGVFLESIRIFGWTTKGRSSRMC
jgi:hypothetical protein